jgi:hypothetical protein
MPAQPQRLTVLILADDRAIPLMLGNWLFDESAGQGRPPSDLGSATQRRARCRYSETKRQWARIAVATIAGGESTLPPSPNGADSPAPPNTT